MKRRVIIQSLILGSLLATAPVLAQSYDAPKQGGVKRGCELNLVGTWEAEKSGDSIFFRFTADDRVTVLSGPQRGSVLREIGGGEYSLDDSKSPKAVLVKAASEGGGFTRGTTPIEIKGYDDTSMTLQRPGAAPARWVRVEPCRYYIVLAGRVGTFYDGSGPTFPMLIKLDGHQIQVDAVGTYADGGKWVFGTIPSATYNEFMREPGRDSEVMLRLEITAAQYERGLKIIKTWERRARNGELLYPDLTMDNILVAKQVTESLNHCGEKFKLYKLDWSLEDRISSSSPRDDNPISRIPFLYFKELKRLNESLHVGDDKFQAAMRSASSTSGR